MNPKIPLRPEGTVFSSLSQGEQTALTWFVLSGCTRKEAFLTFARPDMQSSRTKAAVDDYIRQFFSQKDVKSYIEAYQATLDALLNPPPPEEKPRHEHSAASIEERKAQAKAKLVEFATGLAEGIENADDPQFVLKVADKAGLLDVEEQIEEQPRRYLPQVCDMTCRYRLFVEENCVDECDYCRYKSYANAHGVHYPPEQQLDRPQKSSDVALG